MIKLPRKVEYGLISLIHMAEMSPGAVTTTREMAEQYRLPQELLGKILQALTKAQLIESIQGVKGGYRLRRRLADIGLGEVIEVLDGPMQLTRCTCNSHTCEQESSCNIQESINHFQDQLTQLICSLSIASFQQKAVMLQNNYETWEALDKTQ